jgi:hypothetical protein
MHPEKEIDQGLIGDYVWIKRDLNGFCMSSATGTNLTVRRVGSFPASISDDDLVKFVSKMFTIVMFGA